MAGRVLYLHIYSRQVTRDRAIEFQKNNKIDAFFETSAKTGNNVEDVFALAAKQLYSIHKRDNVRWLW